MPNAHLFDGHIAMLYWTPRSVSETTIDQLASDIRTAAPNVNTVLVKTSNGAIWQGYVRDMELAEELEIERGRRLALESRLALLEQGRN